MNCMKCGREFEESGVFCPECVAEMEKYPVRPGTVVQLPRQNFQPAQKKPPQKKRPTMSLEEQVKLLRRWARMLAVALVLCIVLLVGVGYLAVQQYLNQEEPEFLPGQNYSAETLPSTTPETTRPTETE